MGTRKETMRKAEELASKLKDGYWNTRIIRNYVDGQYQNGEEYHETYMGIYEVYYSGNGTIWAWSEEPMRLVFEDKEELGTIIAQLIEATEKPVLELKDGKITETNEILTEKKGE